MTWVKLDDHFDEHPKIAALSDSAMALWVTSIAYSNRNLTDGFVPHQIGVGGLRYCDGNTIPPIRELEHWGLWEEVEGGWLIHDFFEFQPSRAQVEEQHRQKVAAGQAGGRASAQARASASAQAQSKPVPVPDSVPYELQEQEPQAVVDNNPNQPTPDQLYLAEHLTLTIPSLVKLNKAYGRVQVTDAMREVHGFGDAESIRESFAYLRSILNARREAV